MPSLVQSHKKRSNRKNIRTRKIRKVKKGGSDKVKCCMCGKKSKKEKTLVPRICLEKHGLKAHRICQDCWWDETNGFAREGASHRCPGCEKKSAFTKINKESIIIDLTGE